jgi:hypothetical protein
VNQPTELTDISIDLASRAMAATYRNGAWVETAPSHIIGAVIDDLGYIVVITNDTLTAVYRYTNRDILKRLKQWPKGLDDIIVAATGKPVTSSLGRTPVASLLGSRAEVTE